MRPDETLRQIVETLERMCQTLAYLEKRADHPLPPHDCYKEGCDHTRS